MNISNEPQVTMCTLFVVNFVFLSVTFVGISYFLKIGGNNTQMEHPQIFFQVIIFHCILLSYNCKTFQNSFLFGSIFYGRKIIKF